MPKRRRRPASATPSTDPIVPPVVDDAPVPFGEAAALELQHLEPVGDVALPRPPVIPSTVDLSKALAIKGWMSETELRWLAARASESDAVIEIGAYLGRATRALGDHVRGHVVSVDPWSGTYYNNDDTVARWFRKLGPDGQHIFDVFQQNLGDLIASGRVVPVRAESVQAAAGLQAQVDVVFIDGDHRHEAVARDIEAYTALVKPGGILAGHDYGRPDWPGVKRAVDEAFGDAVHVVDTIWWVRL